MYLKFHQKDKNTILVLPSGAADESRPLYTIKRRITANIPRRYELDLYRNHDRRATWYDPEKPVASISVPKERASLDLRRIWPEDITTSMDAVVHNDVHQCGWRFPCTSWSHKRPNYGVSSRLYARLCRVAEDNKVIDAFRQSVVDVLIWNSKDGLCHYQSFVRIAMREILDGGLQREAQMQRIDEIVMVAVRFCAGRLQFAGRMRKLC